MKKYLLTLMVVLGIAAMASATTTSTVVFDDFESYADSTALNAAWVVNTSAVTTTETLVSASDNQYMQLDYEVESPYWAQTKYYLSGVVSGTSGVNLTYQGYTSLSFDYQITDVGSGVIYFSAYDCWGQKVLSASWTSTSTTTGWVHVTVDFTSALVSGMNLENVAVLTLGANSCWYSTPTGSFNIDNITLTKVVVPEPATMSILALGGLLLRKRK